MQLILLLALCCAHLLYLRLFVPLTSHMDQACELYSAATDVATVGCCFLLLPDRSSAFRSATSQDSARSEALRLLFIESLAVFCGGDGLLGLLFHSQSPK